MTYPTEICADCGRKHGRTRAGFATYYPGTCGWCGSTDKAVTEPRDWCYPPAPKKRAVR